MPQNNHLQKSQFLLYSLEEGKVVTEEFSVTTQHGAIEGKTQTRKAKFYNLDVIISVGYQVNSIKATKFRIWATQTLKQHITQGYTINHNLLKEKKDLYLKATAYFAQEKVNNSLAGIVSNVFQSAFGEEVYKTVEEKAAYLLYFVIKNHPFTDGNKRTGAFSFIWFLQKMAFDFSTQITPQSLTTLSILIAASKPVNVKKDVR